MLWNLATQSSIFSLYHRSPKTTRSLIIVRLQKRPGLLSTRSTLIIQSICFILSVSFSLLPLLSSCSGSSLSGTFNNNLKWKYGDKIFSLLLFFLFPRPSLFTPTSILLQPGPHPSSPEEEPLTVQACQIRENHFALILIRTFSHKKHHFGSNLSTRP